MTADGIVRRHATAIELRSGENAAGILIIGPSGSGKSSLALRMIDQPGFGMTPAEPVSARLVSDDQVVLTRRGDGVVMTSPPAIAGLVEVRGVGIIRTTSISRQARLAFVIEHQQAGEQDRMPAAAHLQIADCQVPHYAIDLASEAAASRVRLLAQLFWGQVSLHE